MECHVIPGWHNEGMEKNVKVQERDCSFEVKEINRFPSFRLMKSPKTISTSSQRKRRIEKLKIGFPSQAVGGVIEKLRSKMTFHYIGF